jgi:hypothetical protein
LFIFLIIIAEPVLLQVAVVLVVVEVDEKAEMDDEVDNEDESYEPTAPIVFALDSS